MMAGFDYAKLKGKVSPLIARFGMPVTVSRPGGIDRVNGEQVIIPATSFEIIGLRDDYQPKEIDGTRIINGDTKFICQAKEEMRVGDIVNINNIDHRVVNTNPIAPAATVMLYQLQLRG